ncbi:MAG TPA: hypothetical protein PLJ32_02395 [Kiritimatiellia bacterium]|jgi:hypothetical protein|nr:hypothetical protein [Kiritimatiellia bacterium]
MKKLLYIVYVFVAVLTLTVALSMLNAKHEKMNTVATVGGAAISETNDALSIIVKTLLEQFDKDENIAVSSQEIEKQREFFVKLAKMIYDQRITYLNKELEMLNVSGDGTVDVSNKTEKIRKEMAWLEPSFFVPADDVLRTNVLLWKRNKALYKRYGGNVYFSHVGPFPADAYKAFFKEKEAERAFEIFDEKLRSDFWGEQFNYTKQSDLLLDDGKKAIETPPWEATIDE